MIIKFWWQYFLILLFSWLVAPLSYASSAFGQTIQIYSQLNDILGKPAWLLTVRNVDTGVVTPYLYDFINRNDFWVAFTLADNYIITVSQVTFDPYEVKITNFCNLQTDFYKRESLYITIQGRLTPDPRTFSCHVLKFPDTSFTITKASSSNNY